MGMGKMFPQDKIIIMLRYWRPTMSFEENYHAVGPKQPQQQHQHQWRQQEEENEEESNGNLSKIKLSSSSSESIYKAQSSSSSSFNNSRSRSYYYYLSICRCWWSSWLWLMISYLMFYTPGINSIQINRFQVPEAVERGHSAILHCDYRLDVDEELYSIKYYKNNIEFFRYVPKENPQKQSYKLIGIYVNLKASNSTHVVLSQTNLNSDGLYICEISTEGPIFSTVRSEQWMKIYVLPDQNLKIHGKLDQYNYGDNISIVCKSGKSWPPTRLEWLINNIPVDSKYVIDMTHEKSASSLISTRIGLNIQARPQYFRNGILEIKCLATLAIVYEYEAIEHLVTGSWKNKNKREWSLQANVKTPIITGIKRNYRLDEILNLNCSTAIRNANLKWFINQNEANDSDLIYYDQVYRTKILGLWIRMDKRHIQMPELQLRCVSSFFKQISQFNSTFKIRSFNTNNANNHDNNNRIAGVGGGIWHTSSSSSSSSNDYNHGIYHCTSYLHSIISFLMAQLIIVHFYINS